MKGLISSRRHLTLSLIIAKEVGKNRNQLVGKLLRTISLFMFVALELYYYFQSSEMVMNLHFYFSLHLLCAEQRLS